MSEIQHYVEFYFPGIITSDTSTCKIKNRDSKFKIPKECYGYRFFDRKIIQEGDEILKGKSFNYSGVRYINGKIYDKKKVERYVKNNETLLSNMRLNGYKKVVKTIFGQFMPLEKNDMVIKI